MVAVPRNQQVGLGVATARIDTLAGQAPDETWKRLSAGSGSKGSRLYGWAMAGLPDVDDTGRSRWVLIRRSITDPGELAFYLCAGPAGTTNTALVRVAGAAGRSRNASSRPELKPASTTTRSAVTRPGTATSP